MIGGKIPWGQNTSGSKYQRPKDQGGGGVKCQVKDLEPYFKIHNLKVIKSLSESQTSFVLYGSPGAQTCSDLLKLYIRWGTDFSTYA